MTRHSSFTASQIRPAFLWIDEPAAVAIVVTLRAWDRLGLRGNQPIEHRIQIFHLKISIEAVRTGKVEVLGKNPTAI